MKILSLALLLYVAASSATAATITKDQLAGTWGTAKSYSIFATINGWFHDTPTERLEIGKNLSVRYIRRFESGQEQVLVAQPSAVTFSEDLLIVRFKGAFGYPTKLVLSGWGTSNAKRLFGTYILYGEEGVFNGISVGFSPQNDS